MPLDRRSFLAAPLMGAVGTSAVVAAIGAGPANAQSLLATAFTDAIRHGVAPGTGDVTAALQSLIDALAETGGTILLAPGPYTISTIRLRTGVVLRGAGPATQIKAASPAPIIDTASQTSVGLAHLTLRSDFAGREAPVPIVQFSDVDGFDIDHVNFSGGGRGLDLTGCSGAVHNSTLAGMTDVAVFSIDATGLEISHNTVEDCGNNGIQVWRSSKGDDGSMVSSNRIRHIRADLGGSGQYGNGINVFRAGGVLATGNRIEDCAYSAFRSNAGSNCQFSGNSCTRIGEVAIYAEFSFEGALVANNVVDDAASGISITNFNEGGRLAVCSGNIIRNLKTRDHYDQRGSGIGAEADTLVTGNVIEGAPVAGISLGYGRYLRNVMATNNIVRDCRWPITVSVSDGAGPAVISGNLIAGAGENTIQGMRRDQPHGGDLASGGAARWPHLTINGNLTATG